MRFTTFFANIAQSANSCALVAAWSKYRAQERGNHSDIVQIYCVLDELWRGTAEPSNDRSPAASCNKEATI